MLQCRRMVSSFFGNNISHFRIRFVSRPTHSLDLDLRDKTNFAEGLCLHSDKPHWRYCFLTSDLTKPSSKSDLSYPFDTNFGRKLLFVLFTRYYQSLLKVTELDMPKRKRGAPANAESDVDDTKVKQKKTKEPVSPKKQPKTPVSPKKESKTASPKKEIKASSPKKETKSPKKETKSPKKETKSPKKETKTAKGQKGAKDKTPVVNKKKEGGSIDKEAPQKGKKRKSEDPPEASPPKLKARVSVSDSLGDIGFSTSAKTPDGRNPNFKIASWNINGIRAWLDKDGISYIKAEKPDVLCVQELKCDISKIPKTIEVDGYMTHWLSGDTEGYSGVGIYYKSDKKPIKITEGIGIAKHDKEGRVLTAEFEKFYLVNTYIPNSGRGLVRLPYRSKEWDVDFRKYLQDLDKKKPVVWCGDLNVAHQEIDIRNAKGNKKNAGFTQEERDGFTETLEAGFIDSFRELHPEEEHAYTFWTYMMNARAKNVGWRLDYFVLSKRFKENLCDSVIRSNVLGSDHCPIVLHIAV